MDVRTGMGFPETADRRLITPASVKSVPVGVLDLPVNEKLPRAYLGSFFSWT
jgi:hypothetical protein